MNNLQKYLLSVCEYSNRLKILLLGKQKYKRNIKTGSAVPAADNTLNEI